MQYMPRLLSVGLLAVALLSACGRDESSPAPPANGDQSAVDLVGRSFSSVRVTDAGRPRDLVGRSRIRISFSEVSLGWRVNCNHFGADLEVARDRLITGDVVTTDIGSPSEKQEQDEWVANFLESDPSWRLTDQDLSLTSGDDEITLEEVSSPEASTPADELMGRTFISTEATTRGEPRPLVDGEPIRLTFERSQRRDSIGWSATCNSAGSTVEITPDRLEIGTIASTLMGCPPHEARQDGWLGDFFAADPEWVLDDGKLTLTSGDSVIEFIESGR